MNKNFLFVVPRYAEKGKYYPFPYGLASVVANMKRHGFNVFVLNLCHEEGKVKDLLSHALQLYHVDVVCSGGMSVHWDTIANVFNAVKEMSSETITVAGGAIVTSDPVLALEALGIDYGVIGEGEETMVELAIALSNDKDVSGVRGVCFLDSDNDIYVTGKRPAIQNLDSLPYPDYIGLGFDKWLDVCPERRADIFTSRSCPYRCTFCYHPLGNRYRQRSLDNVFRELEYLQETFSISMIGVQDEVFSMDRGRICEFAKRIKVFGVPWFVQWRINNVDEDMLLVLKDSNIQLLELGVESYSDKVLKSMKKGITKEQIDRAYMLCDKVGIDVTSNIIIGDPAETEETVEESLGFVRDHPNHVINVGFILAIPASELWFYALDTGRIKDKLGFIRKGFPVINLTGMSDRVFNRIRKQVLMRNLLKSRRLSLLLCLKIIGILLLDENGFIYRRLRTLDKEMSERGIINE